MDTLAFDTCLGRISVALGYATTAGERRVAELSEAAEGAHAERLMPMIRDLLAREQRSFAQIGRIAVTLGPGTFTGVRTGIAAARAFRLATGIEVVGVTSLSTIASHAFEATAATRQARPVLVAVDARRGRLYAEVFGNGPLDSLTGPREVTPDEALSLFDAPSCIAVGSGAPLLAALQAPNLEVPPGAEHCSPSASALIDLAPLLSPLDDIAPIYIRPPDAKPQVGKSLARAT